MWKRRSCRRRKRDKDEDGDGDGERVSAPSCRVMMPRRGQVPLPTTPTVEKNLFFYLWLSIQPREDRSCYRSTVLFDYFFYVSAIKATSMWHQLLSTGHYQLVAINSFGPWRKREWNRRGECFGTLGSRLGSGLLPKNEKPSFVKVVKNSMRIKINFKNEFLNFPSTLRVPFAPFIFLSFCYLRSRKFWLTKPTN